MRNKVFFEYTDLGIHHDPAETNLSFWHMLYDNMNVLACRERPHRFREIQFSKGPFLQASKDPAQSSCSTQRPTGIAWSFLCEPES